MTPGIGQRVTHLFHKVGDCDRTRLSRNRLRDNRAIVLKWLTTEYVNA
jgi:hypothetical protein